MIGRLSDDVLLKIFCCYLDAFPQFWPTLVHICHKWRHIVFASQQALNPRLFCSPGTPVSKALDYWPALPIVMEYGGSLELDHPALENEVDIIAALRQSDRVISISLTVTNSLRDKLHTVKRPLLGLENLILLSQDSVLRIPGTFLWGPRLRRLHLASIDIPSLLRLLHISRNLEDLQLHDALNPQYYSIEKLADALSRMTQLQSLSLHFLSTTQYPLIPLLRDKLIVLPALTHLNLRGTVGHLLPLLDRIGGPRLGDIQVTLIDGPIFNLSIGNFIDRVEMRNSLRQACITSSGRAISISLMQPGSPTCFNLRSLRESSSRHHQLSDMRYILAGFSALLPNVEDLHISATTQGSGDFGSFRWRGILSMFTGVNWLHLDLNTWEEIVPALRKGIDLWPKHAGLPSLYKLYLPQPEPRHAPLSEALVSFMTSRWRSGCPIGLKYERPCRRNEPCGAGTSLFIVCRYH